MALPRLVVFDLDACCWYPEMYMVRRGPPFEKTSEQWYEGFNQKREFVYRARSYKDVNGTQIRS